MPRKKPQIKKRQVNFRLDDETYKVLKRLAQATKRTKTDVVVSLIKRAFA